MTTQDQNQPAWLYLLPMELFDMVVKLLIPLSKVCLALSSKPLFTKLYPSARIPTLKNRELNILFSLLEKDNPHLVLCGEHNKLRPFDSTISQRAQGRPHSANLAHAKWWYSGTPCAASSESSFLLPINSGDWVNASVNRASWMPGIVWPNLTFSELRSVMKRHLYGEKHGLPLEHLAYDYEFGRFIDLDRPYDQSHFPLERHSEGQQVLTPEEEWIFEDENAAFEYLTNPDCNFAPTAHAIHSHHPDSWLASQMWHFRHTSEAKIIKNELYLRRHHVIKGPPVSVASFKYLLETVDLPLCRHIRPSGDHRFNSKYYYHVDMGLPEIGNLKLDRNVHVSRSCRVCYTDYILVIKNPNTSMGWTLDLTTFHRFGYCSSLSDPIWQCATRNSADLPVRQGGNMRGRRRFHEDSEIHGSGQGRVYARFRRHSARGNLSWWNEGRSWDWVQNDIFSKLLHRREPDKFPSPWLDLIDLSEAEAVISQQK
ncbi:uncharacterized protein NECHADRAFT_83093 [Fusarium vanettenii 77-13-4]|uniref:Uncharacterized protein n=1 Tax=Fusarium vanettenii (strain ATCC MYA-4622 / CBS 123669 / FGSC 9596 / NRRL 45880 / 77-13-4) TaxID=660122 RepID=C7ZBC0_FUSV7|nr:uncharacterized protein NECHADRAFT_83093 [Fusarium vanettenii 77-13-4]EEU38691.1 predicted protein [Fusarium vanettenii 77-13-4]